MNEIDVKPTPEKDVLKDGNPSWSWGRALMAIVCALIGPVLAILLCLVWMLFREWNRLHYEFQDDVILACIGGMGVITGIVGLVAGTRVSFAINLSAQLAIMVVANIALAALLFGVSWKASLFFLLFAAAFAGLIYQALIRQQESDPKPESSPPNNQKDSALP